MGFHAPPPPRKSNFHPAQYVGVPVAQAMHWRQPFVLQEKNINRCRAVMTCRCLKMFSVGSTVYNLLKDSAATDRHLAKTPSFSTLC